MNFVYSSREDKLDYVCKKEGNFCKLLQLLQTTIKECVNKIYIFKLKYLKQSTLHHFTS